MYIKLYDKLKKFIKENLWFFIILFFMIFIFNFELPYVVEVPGGFIGLNDRIKMDNSYESNGEFGLAYVSMLKGNIPFVLLSKLFYEWDITPKDDLKYNDESLEDANLRSKIYMNEAISNATYVAYTKADKYVNIKKKKLYVAYNDNQESDLKIGDNIIKINDLYVDDVNSVREYLQSLDTNEVVKVSVIRDNKEMIVDCTIKEYDGVKKMGVAIINNYELETNPNISYIAKDNESGPSGGLMMALSIYDKLIEEDLTKGDKIIGTGTIDMNGIVGEIGGIKYKLIGAVNSKAKVFLCPKENYEEAKEIKEKNNYDIIIKEVTTFDDAIKYLKER